MTPMDPAEAAGLVVIRLWVEPGAVDDRGEGLRARITTARDPDLATEDTHTVAGREGVLGVVEGFLSELANEPPRRGS